MDAKGVEKLINGVEKFGVLDHFNADLDEICLGITGINDPFRLCVDAHRLSRLAILYFPIQTTFYLSQPAKISTSPFVSIVNSVTGKFTDFSVRLLFGTCLFVNFHI